MIQKDNWIYLHIPRTAGSYIESLFRKHYDLVYEVDHHSTVYDIENQKDKFIFGFVSILFDWNPSGESFLYSSIAPIFLFFTIPLLDFLTVFVYRLKNKISNLNQIKKIDIFTSHHTHYVIGTGANDPQKMDPNSSRETLDHSIMYIFIPLDLFR